jgi:hypothetical protein
MLPVQGQYQWHVQSCGIESLLKEPVWRSWFSQHQPLHLNWKLKLNCWLKLPNKIAKLNCRIKLSNRIAKLNYQTEMPNWITIRSFQTEFPNGIA